MESLINKFRRLISGNSTPFRRSLSYKINWDARGICIEGARGTGKSTMMLQHIKMNLSLDQTLYVSLDDLYFRQNGLVETAEKFYGHGGRYLFLDEVHKYDDWQTAVKNIYDFFPEMNLVVSGSSILALQQSRADLSRRMLHYHLPELSFREFLSLKHSVNLPVYGLETILNDHSTIADQIQKVLKFPLKFVKDYFNYGAYPFFIEGEADYFMRINQLINVIIDYDLPEAKAIEVSTLAKLKKLLYIISTSVPFKPNITKLAEQVGTSRSRLLEMLYVLEQSQLIYNLRSSAHGISLMNKPDKIFLHNNSLIAALAEGKPEIGNVRETFFLSQIENSGAIVTYPKEGDFLVNGKYLFEVGGKNKSNDQIKGYENAFIAADDLEYGWDNKIPLWLFGFLY
ncbi:ATP-binding protein [Pedobacter panaciterrae]|uniref:ATP-binding protein n=1 Tax=Pedobacter panaciterrae TaxID=363849 RepID=UPI002593577E|nr:AAA family ATPase [uncultured Pedobacter sp.]